MRMSSRVRTVLGTMEIGRSCLVKDESCFSFLEAYLSTGADELDTALLYSGGDSERIIGRYLKNTNKKLTIATKAYPTLHEKGHKPEGVVAMLEASLSNLGLPSVDIFYLHAPDHNTPIEETLEAVQQLYTAGKFKELGLSNYSAWQVANIYQICKSRGWVLPTVYQGMYNPITRMVEPELIPCLRHFGLRFYAYNALAGGLMTGRYKLENIDKPQDGRFWTIGGNMTEMYRDRFWRESAFRGMEMVRQALDESYGVGKVSLISAAFQWLNHHSQLSPDYNDAIVIGCSKVEHLMANLEACKEGPLTEEVVKAIDAAWELDKPNCVNYFR